MIGRFDLLDRRADMAEAVMTTSSSAGVRDAVSGVVEAALPANTADNADEQDRAQESATATPITTHSALLGVKNAIDASYVSCRRRLSRRV